MFTWENMSKEIERSHVSVAGVSVAGVAEELGISERQAYRDCHRALEELAQVLRSYVPSPATAEFEAVTAASPFEEELARLMARPKHLNPEQVLRGALEVIEPLADHLGTGFEYSLAPNLPLVSADEGILKQVLIQMLSLAAQSASLVQVGLAPESKEGTIVLVVSFYPDRQPPPEKQLSSLQYLAESQHLDWSAQQNRDGSLALVIYMKVAQPHTVLVVEDNEGAIELYRRYLAQNEGYHLVGATDPRATYDMASHLRPAAIILDIMMPAQDGWSVLQRLRTDPGTASIPIIICSVCDDPELAVALGANAYLKKPVSQFQLLAALHRCLAE